MANTEGLRGEMRRLAGVLTHPRSTMASLVAAPSWLTAWAVLLLIWLAPAGWLLSTSVGQQALVDERVRQVEAFGGRVDDEAYGALQQSPPLLAYFTSGGRLLLSPPVTLAVAAGLMLLVRLDGAALSWAPALAISVHASAPLVLQQLVATPLHYLSESLSSPSNLSVFLRMFDEGTVPARILGAVDVFGLWWLWLLAVGAHAAARRPARRYLWRLLVVYLGIVGAMALVMALTGGS
jgi:hypothetical protein